MKQRILAILLSLTMIFTLVPTAMAEGEEVSAGEGSKTPAVEYVAQIGDAKYDTLAKAVEAATDGATITLLKDAELTETLNINKAITLDGANHKITGNSSAGKTSFITVETDGDFTMKNATILPTSNVEANPAIDLQVKGKVVVDNCVFGAADDTNQFMYNGLEFSQNEAYPMADETTISNCTFYGGSFRHNFISFYRMADGATININGNKFLNANWNDTNAIRVSNYSNVNATINLLNDTYSDHGADAKEDYAGLLVFQELSDYNDDFTKLTVNIKNLDTTGAQSDQLFYVYKDSIISTNQPVVKGDSSIEKFFVAKVDDTYYKTLAEAVAAADNATVTLLKDVTENVTIPADKTITLDLNGKTLTNVDDHTILNNGNLTITGTGKVDNISHAKGALYNKGTVIVNGGTFDRTKENGKTSNDSGSNSWYTIKNVGTMTINDGATVQTAGNNAALGKFSSLVSNGYFDTNDYNTNKGLDQPILTIDGGTFRGGLNTIKNDDRAKLTINGGTFSNYYQAVVQNHNIAEITGGTFTAASDANAETYGIYNCGCGAEIDLGTLTVSGGTFTGATYAVAEVSSQKAIVNISGGQFAGTKAAIIKSSTSNATIAISGGSFSQPVKKDYLDSSLNAELKRASGETPYSYYTSMNDALAAAKPGDTVTDLNATTESKVTLTLKYNDGATADTTCNVASGTTITLPTPARIGYTFNGWYDGSTFYAAGASYKVSATVTLNASWSYISSGSSSYDPTYSVSTPSKTENGSVTVSPKSASKGSTVTITVKPDSGYVLETLTVTDKNGDELKLTDKGNGKYTFTMPGSKVEVKATFMEDNSVLNFFYDVPNGAYFYEAVKWAVDKGVTNGLSDTMFGPYESCTRAQIVTFLWRAAGSPEPKTASSFTDVPANAYYAKAVAWAVENGITNGMTATMFAPDATCTRGQSVTFLYRALKGTASATSSFVDVSANAFYADAVGWAVSGKVTDGTSSTTFSPDDNCTRGQIVTFLYRAYQGK